MKQNAENGMKSVNVNTDLTVESLIINNVGVMINAGMQNINW